MSDDGVCATRWSESVSHRGATLGNKFFSTRIGLVYRRLPCSSASLFNPAYLLSRLRYVIIIDGSAYKEDFIQRIQNIMSIMYCGI